VAVAYVYLVGDLLLRLGQAAGCNHDLHWVGRWHQSDGKWLASRQHKFALRFAKIRRSHPQRRLPRRHVFEAKLASVGSQISGTILPRLERDLRALDYCA